MPEPTKSELARLLREHTGIGLQQAVQAIRMAEDPDFGGDVVLAVGFLDANALAINVKGDRRAWNLARAVGTAERLRERYPEIDAAFPVPPPVPAP